MFVLTKKRLPLFTPLLCLAVTACIFAFWRNRVPRTLNTSRAISSPAIPLAQNEKAAFKQPDGLIGADSDEDGVPDSAELQSFQDRENFRKWFRFIAEIQFYRVSEQWNSDQRDCAGLIRFAWREALRAHDRRWLQRMGPGYEVIAPDVAAYNLESGPLKESLFRINARPVTVIDRQIQGFSEFADARTLKEFNSTFVGRDRRYAQPGDLLFFYQPWVQRFPYHVMIFIDRPQVAPEGMSDFVVYHTGSSVIDKGTVKKVQLSVLDQHPDKRWRPLESNRNFLGFYRLKILD